MTIVQWIIAAGTSLFVALVGYFQYRTARIKFALELFERRYETYMVVRKAVGQVTAKGTLDSATETELGEAISKAYFFFGNDLVKYLAKLQDDFANVVMYTAETNGVTDTEERKHLIQNARAAKDRIFAFYKEGKPLFGKYMRFKERIPHAQCSLRG
jgi:hypothetical protein